MKIIMFAFLIAAVGALFYFKPWADRDAPVNTGPPSETFMGECIGMAPPDHDNPKAFCRCLWSKGISKTMHIQSQPRGRAAWVDCSSASGPH